MSNLLPLVKNELDRLATFYRTEASIGDFRGDCSQNGLVHPVIWILSPHDQYNKELTVEAAKVIHEHWPGLFPKFKTHNVTSGYPFLGADTCNQMWIFFFADRVDIQSEAFKSWEDKHREFLRSSPPILVKWYTKQQLLSVDASIFESSDDKELISGFKCPVLSLEAPDVLFTQIAREELVLLLGFLTLQAYREVAPPSYKSYWHSVTSGLLEELRSNLEGPSKTDLSFDDALHIVFHGHREMTRWEQLCKKIEDLKELPECEPGTRWDKLMSDCLRESANVARDRIYIRRRQKDKCSSENSTSYERHYSGALAEFQKLSDKITELSEDLARALEDRDELDKAGFIRTHVKESSASLQLILYGPFSSGKTTFVNTLLGLKEGSVLPVKGTPTTSTFNLVEYDERESFEPSFLGTLDDFTLIGGVLENGMSRYRVHRAEMEAFQSWYKDDMLQKKNLKVRILYRKRNKVNVKEEILQKSHLDAIELLFGNKAEYVDQETVLNSMIPISVIAIAFKKKYTVSSFEDLDRLGSKAALMIEKIRVGRNHMQLRHVTIVDTPGVDSCIPYHHTMSRSYIEGYPNSPIIYFIDGKRAGGNTDKKSIKHLLTLSERRDSHLGLQNRTFFLITKRDEINECDRVEVLNKAKEVIKEQQWRKPTIYLVDSLAAAKDATDHDWANFSKSVQSFIRKYQITYLKGVIENLEKNLDRWIVEEDKKIEELDKSIDSRRESSKLRTRYISELNRFKETTLEVYCNEITGKNLLYMSGSSLFEEAVSEAINDLGNVDTGAWKKRTRDNIVSEMKGVVDGLTGAKYDWKGSITENLAKHSKVLSQRIINAVTEISDKEEFEPIRPELRRCSAISLCPPKSDFVSVLWESDVISALNSNDRIISNFFGRYDKGIEEYRSRIISALRKTLDRSIKTTDEEFNRIRKDYTLQIDRAVTLLNDMSRTSLSSSGKDERDRVTSSKVFYEKWKRQVNGAFSL